MQKNWVGQMSEHAVFCPQPSSQPVVSRMAPTPSGYLHLGNAVNFLVTWVWVRRQGGTLHLRIDDMDGIRTRPEIVEDIFRSLEWLGLDWDSGPMGPEAFYREFSLQHRRDYYRECLMQCRKETDLLFACSCSRKKIAAAGKKGLYPGTCRYCAHPLVKDHTALRLHVAKGTLMAVGTEEISLDEAMGDFVLWRKDDMPAYHLASVLEDAAHGVNLIVRGRDLLVSTAAQLYLAEVLGADLFQKCQFYHHDLILDQDGKKLSKSRGAYALKDLREYGGDPASVFRSAAPFLGIAPEETVTSLADLLQKACC